ncbi:unnamed protein product [Urochloa humidicola]
MSGVPEQLHGATSGQRPLLHGERWQLCSASGSVAGDFFSCSSTLGEEAILGEQQFSLQWCCNNNYFSVMASFGKQARTKRRIGRSKLS